jgi:hypothetical protein
MKRFRFFYSNWKFGVHLLFHTRHFGVNNEWWCRSSDMLLGWPLWRIIFAIITIKPLVTNWRMMKYRAGAGYAMNNKEFHMAYGETRDQWMERLTRA